LKPDVILFGEPLPKRAFDLVEDFKCPRFLPELVSYDFDHAEFSDDRVGNYEYALAFDAAQLF